MKKIPFILLALLTLSASGYFLWQKQDSPIELSSNMIFHQEDDELNIIATNLLNQISILDFHKLNPSDIQDLMTLVQDLYQINLKEETSERNKSLDEEDSADDGEARITPVGPIWLVEDSKSFSALEKTSTGEVALKGEWNSSNENEEDDDSEENDEDCDNSSNCTLKSKKTGTFTMEFVGKGHTLSAPYTVTALTFNDPIPTWASSAIATMQEFGLMQGYDANTFGSGDPLTRAQIAVVVFRAMEQYSPFRYEQFYPTEECESRFEIPKDHWAFKAICFGESVQWFRDLKMENNTFGMNQPVTRAEMTSILQHSLLLFASNFTEKDPTVYRDVFEDVSRFHPYKESIMSAYFHGVVEGTLVGEKRYFYPEKTLNRAEFATMMQRALIKLVLFNKAKKNYNHVDDDSRKI